MEGLRDGTLHELRGCGRRGWCSSEGDGEALLELSGSLDGKGEHEDLARIHALHRHEMHRALHHRVRLARTRARPHRERLIGGVLSNAPLALVQGLSGG